MKAKDLFALFGQVSDNGQDIRGVSDSASPQAGHLTFIKADSPANREVVNANPSAVFLVPTSEQGWPDNCITVKNPRLAYAIASREVAYKPLEMGVAATAQVHSAADLDETVAVGHFTVIDEGVSIGSGTVIGSHVRIHAGVSIGTDCEIADHASIGTPGFGFEVDGSGRPIRLAHVGGVEIGNRVEVGTQVSIAQGTLTPTRISDDVKIDDAVFIAHNATIGEGSFVIAGARVCGSAEIGRRCWISPGSTIMNKVSIGDDALVGLGAVVIRDVPDNTVVAGVPAKPRGPRW